MKRVLTAVVVGLSLLGPARSEPSLLPGQEAWLEAYLDLKAADRLAAAGYFEAARRNYRDALDRFERIKGFGESNIPIMYRKRYCRERLAELEGRADDPRPIATAPDNRPAAAPSPKPAGPAIVPADCKELALQAGELFRRRHFDEAAALYRQIIDRHPQSPFGWSMLGAVRVEQLRVAKAEQALEQAVSLCPADGFSCKLLGIAYYYDNKREKSLEMLKRAQAHYPDDPGIDAYQKLLTN